MTPKSSRRPKTPVVACVEINQCVGCSFLGDDAAVLAPSSGEEGHRHAIEQASRRWRGGRRDDSARTRRKILISTQVVRRHHIGVAYHPGALAHVGRRLQRRRRVADHGAGAGGRARRPGGAPVGGRLPGARRRAGPDAGAAARLRSARRGGRGGAAEAVVVARGRWGRRKLTEVINYRPPARRRPISASRSARRPPPPRGAAPGPRGRRLARRARHGPPWSRCRARTGRRGARRARRRRGPRLRPPRATRRGPRGPAPVWKSTGASGATRTRRKI